MTKAKVTAAFDKASYRKRYPKAEVTNAAYKRLLAKVDRLTVKLDQLKHRIEDLEGDNSRIRTRL